MKTFEQKEQGHTQASRAGLTNEGGNPNASISELLVNTTQPEPSAAVAAESQSQRIKSNDYRAWDRYDVEKELGKLELNNNKTDSAFHNLSATSKPKVSRIADIPRVMKKPINASQDQLSYLANQERIKGNDAFRAGEFDEAVRNSSLFLGSFLVKLIQCHTLLRNCTIQGVFLFYPTRQSTPTAP